MSFLPFLIFLFFIPAWSKEKPKTSFSYKIYQTFPKDLERPGDTWVTEERLEEVFFMQNGDMLLEIKKNNFYVLYSSETKSYYFVDQRKKTRKSLLLNTSPQGMTFKHMSSQVEECGKKHTLSSRSKMGELKIDVCLTSLNSEFTSPLLQLFINPKIRESIQLASEHFLTHLSTTTMDGHPIYKREFHERTTGKKLSPDLNEFLKFKLVEPACEEMYCGNLMNLREN